MSQSDGNRNREQRAQLDSAIIGVTLMKEGKFEDAERCLQPLIAWADPSEVSELIGQMNEGPVTEMMWAADFLKQKGRNCTSDELDDVSGRLVKALEELRSRR